MRRTKRFEIICALAMALFSFTACVKDTNIDPPPPPDASFAEDFDTMLTAYNKGWRTVNRSEPIGPSQWQQGSGAEDFVAYTSLGNNQGFAFADYVSTSADAGLISNWLISPVTLMKNGDKISFYTRSQLYDDANGTGDSTDYANRMQLRVNITNDGINAGNGMEPGDFTELLVDINPTYVPFVLSEFNAGDPLALKAYPHKWKRYEGVISGVETPVKGRFAFRYLLEDGGQQGRGTGVGVDQVSFLSTK